MPIERSSLTLCCVGLVLSSPRGADVRQQGQVDEQGAVALELAVDLAQGFQERLALDVADGAADFGDDRPRRWSGARRARCAP